MRIIDDGKIRYDGELAQLIEKYATYKLVTVTFSGKGIERIDIEKYGELSKFDFHQCVLKVPREKAKDAARDILSSDLPVDDILIDETEISEVVRGIFSNGK